MTKEQILAKNITNSTAGSVVTIALKAMEEYANQELTAERESHINMVKQIVELLGFAKCLNILDALEKWQKEREKAAKLVEALECMIPFFEGYGPYTRVVDIKTCIYNYKQSLTEYKKQ